MKCNFNFLIRFIRLIPSSYFNNFRPNSTHKTSFQCYTLWRNFNVHGSVHHKNILIYIQQDATLHSLFYLETALRVSGGTSIYQQERKQLYLQHLVFVTPLLLPAAIATGSSNGVTNNRCCIYSCLRS
jgi:hypothetical protein